MLTKAASELNCLKDEIDEVSLDQRQGDKDLQSQWVQTKMLIEPNIDSTDDTLRRKIEMQKHENQNLLKQLIDLKKQHNIMHSQIAVCRAKVQELRKTVG